MVYLKAAHWHLFTEGSLQIMVTMSIIPSDGVSRAHDQCASEVFDVTGFILPLKKKSYTGAESSWDVG